MAVLCVLGESRDRERRVAVVPAEVSKLTALGLDVVVEAGAGEAAGFEDGAYAEAGASVAADPVVAVKAGGLAVMVGPPRRSDIDGLPSGTGWLSFLPPAWCLDVIEALAAEGITSFSFDMVPRTSRAQSVDALSSQAGVAGYQAAILAAARLPRLLPMMMTAAGTVPPARVLVIGAGVAGLQAIATARRLGASVSGYDVRPEAAEEIRSLGAAAIELPILAAAGDGGYAAAQSTEFTERQQELLASAVAASDVVITTAAIPGRAAPRIVTTSMLEAMRKGSVVIDLAASSGGNCDLTVEGSELEHHGVVVIGASDLASEVAGSASALYARNVTGMAKLLVADGELRPDFDDDIVAATCVTHAGEIRDRHTRALVEGADL